MTDRQAQIFYDASEPEYDPASFAIGGKGLGSAAGAGDARNKAEVFCLQCTRVSSTIVNHSSKREKRHAKQKTTASRACASLGFFGGA